MKQTINYKEEKYQSRVKETLFDFNNPDLVSSIPLNNVSRDEKLEIAEDKQVSQPTKKQTVETTTQIAEEIYQGRVEDAARAGEGVPDSFKYISWDKSKDLFYEMLPIAPLSAFGAIKGAIKDTNLKNDVKS